MAAHVILRGCEEILSEGGSEGRERRIFGYTGSTLPTERRRNHRPRCATNRTVCAIGPSPAGVTGRSFASAPRPHPAQDFFTTSERSEGSSPRRSFAVCAAQDDERLGTPHAANNLKVAEQMLGR